MAEVRGYLKASARTTWQMAAWLTHSANAIRYDGMLVVDATYAVLNAYGAALLPRSSPHGGSVLALQLGQNQDCR